MTKADITLWLQKQISQESGIPLENVSSDEDFANFKLDSLCLVSIAFDLESQIKMEISPTAFIEFNTINKLAEWITLQK